MLQLLISLSDVEIMPLCFIECLVFNVMLPTAVAESEIFLGRGAKYLMSRQKDCRYTGSVTSYIILGMPGEALRPFVTNGINFFKQTNI